jgi:NADP-dependent 3-hydroxy acid dehydrogenase YdfG
MIGAHSEKSCEEAIKVLQRSTGSDKVSCLQLDLASFKSVKNFAAQIQEKISKKNIDLLISRCTIII